MLHYVRFPETERFIPEQAKIKEIVTLLGYTLDSLRSWRDQLVAYGEHQLRITGNLLDLLEYADHEHIKRDLKYESLLGFELLEMAEILRLINQILSETREPLRNEIFDGRRGVWKIPLYGHLPTKHDPLVMLSLVTEFGLNPDFLMIILCEGQSDSEFISYTLQNLNFVDRPFIKIEPLGGTTKSISKHQILTYLKERLTPRTGPISEQLSIVPVHSKFCTAVLFFDPENLFRPSKRFETEEEIKDLLKHYLRHNLVKGIDIKYYLGLSLKFFILDEPLEFNFLEDTEIIHIIREISNNNIVPKQYKIANIRKTKNPTSNLMAYLKEFQNDMRGFKLAYARTAAPYLSSQLKNYVQEEPMKERLSRFSAFVKLIVDSIADAKVINALKKETDTEV